MSTRRVVACLLVIGAAVCAERTAALGWPRAAGLGLLVTAAIAWLLMRCPHTGPLALLPASTDFLGTARPPRWFCDGCGREWPAHFERAQTPVQKFSGYDESKAVRAAEREAEMVEARRRLALTRAATPAAAKKATPAEPVRLVRKAGGQ